MTEKFEAEKVTTRSILEKVSVVIPTEKEDPENIETINSIPEGVDSIYIQNEDSIAQARNYGVERADTEIIVELDDDIQVDKPIFINSVKWVFLDRYSVVGMEGWDFDLIVTRFIAFHRSAFYDVGGFDTRLGGHMEDTDFAIKLQKNGYNLKKIPQEEIEHIDHPTRINTWDRLWRLCYLSAKHPSYTKKLWSGVL